MLPTFRERYPRLQLEIMLDERFVDIVAEDYDAGVRLTEAIERDMVRVRLTDAFRFVIVGAPEYLKRHGTPESAVANQLREGRLKRVLDAYAPTVPGFFLYYPRWAQRSPLLRAFVDTARSWFRAR